MKNAAVNLGAIKKIAGALEELNKQVVYVGGAVVSLYINDPAADDVRPTKDIDITLQITSFSELEKLRKELVAKGFYQTAEDNVICRFRYEDLKVDVMSTKAIAWAPANPWFEPGFAHLETMELESHAIQEELRQSGRGQVFGFILGIVGLALATALALSGHETIAGIFGTTTILGLVTVFVIGKKSQQKDLKEKE